MQGRPASTPSKASARPFTGASTSASLASPELTPCASVVSVCATPRSEGSAARGPRKGCAWISWAVVSRTCGSDWNSRPSLAKKGPPSGRRTVSNALASCERRADSLAAPDSASSSVAPSTTATIRSSFCGKALETAISS